MRTLFELFGSLLLLACLVAPAEADGMRPLNGGRGSFMFSPASPILRFHGPLIGHGRPSNPHRIVQGPGLKRQFIIVNPGPVPPLTGTIVPPFSVGGVHMHIVGLDDRLFIRKHRSAIGMFPGDHRRDRFHGGFPAEPFFLLETTLPDETKMFGDGGEDAGASLVEATSPDAPIQGVAGPAEPTWRSGRSVLTGTLEEPQVIVVNPAGESRNVRIFTPSTDPAHAPQIVEVPAQ
jgi:hypothetical protein